MSAQRGLMMNATRRFLLFRAASVAAMSAAVLRAPRAWASTDFEYDALGRLARAVFSDGRVVRYSYDAAGNRIQVESSGGEAVRPRHRPRRHLLTRRSMLQALRRSTYVVSPMHRVIAALNQP